MIVNFDALRHIEKPELLLCNPGSVRSSSGESVSKLVGIIPDHSDEEFVFNFNSPSELNFRAHYIPDRDNGSADTVYHQVVPGDTINDLAKKYDIPAASIVSDNQGTYSTINANMNVPAGFPVITTQPTNCTVASSSNITFSIAATGSNLSYQWQYMGRTETTWKNSTAAGNRTQNLTITPSSNPLLRNGQKYRCIVSNATGVAISDAVYVILTDAPPFVVVQPEDVSVCLGGGQAYSFHVGVAGSGLTYQWEISATGVNWDNSTLTGNTTDTASGIAPSSAESTNKYRCAITNSYGTVYSNVVTRYVVSGLPVVTTNPSNRSGAMNTTVTFNAAASGTVTGCQWQYRTSDLDIWSDIIGQTGLSLSVQITPANNGKYYRCTFTNSAGTVVSTAARLTATSYPMLTVGWNLVMQKQNVDSHTKRIFTSIQNRRLIYCLGIGYFVITGVTDGFDGHTRYKDVSAESVEIEIQGHTVPFIPDGTYRFTTDPTLVNPGEGDVGMLNRMMNALPLWEIDYVEDSVAKRFRSFSDVDASTNILSFMIDNMQNAYECIFVFDIQNRVVRVYDQNHYTQSSNVYLSKEDFVDAMDVSENSDDLYTAINAVSDTEVTISAVNPLGTNTIYRFDHYTDWMTPSLGAKVRQWEEEIALERNHYTALNRAYYDALTSLTDIQLEIEMLNLQKTMYQRCRDNIVAGTTNGSQDGLIYIDSYNETIVEAGGNAIIATEINAALTEIDADIASVNAQITDRTNQLNTVQSNADSYLDQINAIADHFAFSKYFTQVETDELYGYIFEGQYRDEYVIITEDMSYDEQFDQMCTLYDRAYDTLVKTSEPTQEYNVDVASVIFEKDFEHISDQLHTGYLIDVELLDGDVAKLFLSTMTVNYEDHSFTMTFGNRYNKFDPRSLFENVLGSVSKSANSISNIKGVISPIKDGELNAMQRALQNSRDITMGKALEANDEEVVIDQSGYTGRTRLNDGTYDPRQVKIVGKSIVFTDDGWDSAKVAIGEIGGLDGTGDNTTYGINAQYVMGEMIIGNGLVIKNENGDDMFSVLEGEITTSVSGVVSSVDTLSDTVNTLSGTVTTNKQDADKKYNLANSEITKMQTTIQQLPDSINFTVSEAINGQDSFSPATGYTFDAEGLKIEKAGSAVHNRLDDTGMYVTRTSDDSAVLTANNNGVNAVNLTARNFLIFGTHARFEALPSDDTRVACFYI